MSTINWVLTGDEVNEINSSKDLSNPISCDINEVNKIASKMQYLSSHALNKTLSVNDKIAYFHSYEKSRMDFLADIATATPTMESSKLFYGELVAGIDKNRILLDRISGIDNFKYQIVLHDCRHCDKSQCFSDVCRKEISSSNDFAVAIPNDIIGQHALYIIIENLIRNTAKHSAKQGDDLVSFYIEVREPDIAVCNECPELKGYYEIHIYDNISEAKSEEDFKDEDKSFFKANGLDQINGKSLEQLDKIDRLEKLVYRQNIFINLPLLNDENKLRQNAWGMIEMEAAAAYLRKIPVENIDNAEYDLRLNDLFAKDYSIIGNRHNTVDILKTFIKETKDGKRQLAYRFFMLKPKEILIIIDDDVTTELGKANTSIAKFSSSLVNYGIWLKNTGDKEIEGVERFDDKTIYEHEILLNLTKGKIEPNVGVLPDRILKSDLASELVKVNDGISAKRFKEMVWTEFSNQQLRIFINNYSYQDETMFFGETENPDIKVNFSHHGPNWNTGISPLFPSFPGSYQYLEVTTGLNNLTDILRKAALEREIDGKSVEHERNEAVYAKLLSSIDAQVIVLDERIQEAAYSLKYQPEATITYPKPDSIPFHELYMASGIYVPHPKTGFNFSRISYASENGEIAAREQVKRLLNNTTSIYMNNGNNVNFNRVKFLVIHLGVLEKILNAEGERKNDPEKERETIKKLVEELKEALPESLKGKVKPVIISGRGLPPNLPPKIPYVSYSAISQYLIDNRNKYLLTELLFSTRKIQQR